jgi:hypothetical protein
MDVTFHKHCILKSWMAAGMDMPDRNLEQMMQPKLPVGVVICFSVNGR